MATGKTRSQDSGMMARKIFLRETGDYVGPFCSSQEARQFIEVMKLFGAGSEGIEVVELESGGTEMERNMPLRKNATTARLLRKILAAR